MKIAFLIANGYGMGGTIRTVFTSAGGLAARHDVEIVSLVQHRRTPFFALPAGVAIRGLTQARAWAQRPRASLIQRYQENRRGPVVPRSEKPDVFNLWTEQALRRYLSSSDAEVVVATRPGLNMLLARHAPERLLTIGQEHVHLGNHKRDVTKAIARLYPRLDGMTVLTESDRRAYAAFLPSDPGWVVTMPNALPAARPPASTLEAPVIAAAGRLAPVKQYGKLLEAFTLLARRHPQWTLRIYGGGESKAALQARTAALGLQDRVRLMGRRADLAAELANASVLAVSSRTEGFGMTIIEAFSVGVPVVSFDCPHGPREIITHGHDGLLVPRQDVGALAEALDRLLADDALRRAMGTAALASAQRYGLAESVRRWEGFIAARQAARRARIPW